MGKWLLLLVICCTLATASQKGWKPENVPNPKTHPSACIDLAASKYAPEGEAQLESMWVCNPDRILAPATVDTINKELTDLALTKRSEECKRGTQVGVVVIGKMAGASTEDNARKFAQGVHDSWGVGDSKCNNGAVFILARDDRKWYISTGAGVKNILTSDAISHIGSKITPTLKEHDYDEAVLIAVKEMAHILISGEYISDGWNFGNLGDILVVGFFGLYILYLLICVLVACGRKIKWYLTNYFQRRRQRRDARRALDDMERRFRQGGPAPPHVSITMCPICLEAFPAPTPNHPHAEHSHNDDAASGSSNGSNNNNNSNNNNDGAQNTTDLNNDSDDENAPEILFCGHKFHKRCINDWLSRNDSCPICRRRAPRYSEAPPESLRQQQVLGADEAFFRFANTRFYYNYSFWTIPSPPRAPPNSIWTLPSGGSGSSSFGGGFSFGGGGGGGSW